MYKIGLKLWSTNERYINDAQCLYDKGLYDYVELFAVPGSYDQYHGIWQILKNKGIPFVIHAPHSMTGLNLANEHMRIANKKLAQESFKFADLLDAGYVIFHLGVDGEPEEAARQLKSFNDSRMLIENKPYYGLNETICVGYLPEQIAQVMDFSSAKFCFDIGHAIYAANGLKLDQDEVFKKLLELNPAMYHLSDGDNLGVLDGHKHLGEGSFDLLKIMGFIPQEAMISLETPKNYQNKLDDFEQDSIFLRRYANQGRAHE